MGIMGKKEYKEACQPEGNYFDKYGSNNPIVKRLMKGYFDSFGKLLSESGISRGGGISWKPDAGKGMWQRLCRRR